MPNYFKPPTFGDWDKDERARVLLQGVWLITIGIELFAVMQIAAAHTWMRFGISTSPIAVTLPPLALLCLEMNRRGYSRAAGWVFIVSYIVATCLRAPFSGGVRAPSVGMLPVMTVFAGLVLGRRSGFAVAAACGVLGAVLVLFERIGIGDIHPIDYPPLVYWGALCLNISLSVFLLRTVFGRTSKALAEARAELAARKQAEGRLAVALDAGAIGVFNADLSGDVIVAHERLCRMLGLPDDHDGRLKHTDIMACLHPEDRPRFAATLRTLDTAADDKQGHPFRVVLPSGELRFLVAKARVYEDAESGVRVRTGTVIDVTEHTLAQQALRDTDQTLKVMLENTASGMALLGPDGRLVRSNAALQRMLGYPEDELVGKSFADCTHPDDVSLDAGLFEQMMAGKRAKFEIEARCVAKDGHTVWVHRVVSAVFDDGGSPVYSVVVINDITAQKDAERERQAIEARVRQAENLRGIGLLARGVAHDFNNILGAIQGFSQLLEEDLPPESAEHRFASRITDATNRGKAVVEQILSFARQSAQPRSPAELGALVAELRPLLDSLVAEGVQLNVTTSGALWAQVNLGQMTQVLSNLCKNASDAMEGRGGSVSVQVRRLTAPIRARLFNALNKGHANIAGVIDPGVDYGLIQVGDEGVGIAPDRIGRVFEPFYTTKDRGRGTGLGLAVVRAAAEEMGGACAIQSRPGRGATISLLLPLIPAPKGPKKITAARRGPQGGRVLIVDDEPDIADVLATGLARRGYDVVSFNDPRAALAALQDRIGDWSLLITDGQMHELRGSDLARAARTMRPELPVVLYSGFDSAMLSTSDDDGGLFDLRLTKPMDIDEMVGRLGMLPTAPIPPADPG